MAVTEQPGLQSSCTGGVPKFRNWSSSRELHQDLEALGTQSGEEGVVPGATGGDLNYSRDCEQLGAWQTGMWHIAESVQARLYRQDEQEGLISDS